MSDDCVSESELLYACENNRQSGSTGTAADGTLADAAIGPSSGSQSPLAEDLGAVVSRECIAADVVPEDSDPMIALRAAALRTLKSRSLKKRSPDATARYLLSPGDVDDEVPGLAGAAIPRLSQRETVLPQRPTPPPTKAAPPREREGKRRHYQDVDSPSLAYGGELSYAADDGDAARAGPSVPRRQRVSYADEFDAKPSAPSGELDKAWLGASLDRPQRPGAPPVSRAAPSVRAREVAPAPKKRRRFLEHYPSKDALVIDWSDEDDTVEPALHARAKQNTILSRKTLEIRALTERIRALEQQRELQSSSAAAAVHASSVLGKRAFHTDATDASGSGVPHVAAPDARTAAVERQKNDETRAASQGSSVKTVRLPHSFMLTGQLPSRLYDYASSFFRRAS